MPRQIRIGDTVQGFLRPDVKGKVIGFNTVNNNQITVEATSSNYVSLCVVKMEKTGEEITIRTSDVFIVDY